MAIVRIVMENRIGRNNANFDICANARLRKIPSRSPQTALVAEKMNIGFLLFPHLTALDLTGPAQVFSAVDGANIHLVWKTLDAVSTDAGYRMLPTHTFDTCPALDLLCVPGGPGQLPLMRDRDVLRWLNVQGRQTAYVTSVCSGSLLLGAAQLLDGYRATSHWAYCHLLPQFGAITDRNRVVIDRNRITGGGVTAGIDFALAVVAQMRGDEAAKRIQLLLEYNPEPPFDSGHPGKVPVEFSNAVALRIAEQAERCSSLEGV
jgi:cyclohexyl-isocyanide hydratase